MRPARLLVPFTLLALVVAAGAPARTLAADAVEPEWGQSRGFCAGLEFIVDGLTIGNSSDPGAPHIDQMGSGLALAGGYSFSPHFHTRLMLGSTRHSTSVAGLDVMRAVATIDAQYRFLPGRQVCPYIMGSLGGGDLRADQGGDHVKFSSSTAGVGGGLRVGLTRHVVMDVGARLEVVNWKDAAWSRDLPGGGSLQYQTAVEQSGGSSRLELGWLWQF